MDFIDLFKIRWAHADDGDGRCLASARFGSSRAAAKIDKAATESRPKSVLNPHVPCTHAIKGMADAITEKVTM